MKGAYITKHHSKISRFLYTLLAYKHTCKGMKSKQGQWNKGTEVVKGALYKTE
jgi:hypothetical protein